MEQPLSEYDCDAWRTRLDTLMHDATLATTLRWKQEILALATIDRLRAANAKLLSELAGLATDAETFLDAADDRYERMRFRENLMSAVRVARAVIKEARK